MGSNRAGERTSKMMTVSAVSRLIPSPPARVERRNAKSGDPGALKCAMDFFRTSDATVPKTGKYIDPNRNCEIIHRLIFDAYNSLVSYSR